MSRVAAGVVVGRVQKAGHNFFVDGVCQGKPVLGIPTYQPQVYRQFDIRVGAPERKWTEMPLE
jgi:hypothetical protein